MAAEAIAISGEVPGELVQFGTFHHPDRFLATAELVAAAFKKRADQLSLFKQIGPGKHLLVEGWQMLAAMYHVSASLESDAYVTFGDAAGFEATYTAIHVPSGVTISRATGMCLNTEENWGLRPRYETDWTNKVNGKPTKKKIGMEPAPLQQIRSMAQTRAESKCLSNVLKWVAKMAGFAVTPAEEMDDNTPTNGKESVQQPQQKQNDKTQTSSGAKDNLISENQAKRIWGIGFSYNVPKEKTIEILKAHGFEDAAHVTKDKYEAVVAAVEQAAVPK